jgi:hypothetical protein
MPTQVALFGASKVGNFSITCPGCLSVVLGFVLVLEWPKCRVMCAGCNWGGGGGSGGSVLIEARSVSGTGTVSADGARGGARYEATYYNCQYNGGGGARFD